MRVKMCYFVWHAKADGDWYTFTILPWKLMFENNFKTTICEYSHRQGGPWVYLPKGLNTTELTLGLSKVVVGKESLLSQPCNHTEISKWKFSLLFRVELRPYILNKISQNLKTLKAVSLTVFVSIEPSLALFVIDGYWDYIDWQA